MESLSFETRKEVEFKLVVPLSLYHFKILSCWVISELKQQFIVFLVLRSVLIQQVSQFGVIGDFNVYSDCHFVQPSVIIIIILIAFPKILNTYSNTNTTVWWPSDLSCHLGSIMFLDSVIIYKNGLCIGVTSTSLESHTVVTFCGIAHL